MIYKEEQGWATAYWATWSWYISNNSCFGLKELISFEMRGVVAEVTSLSNISSKTLTLDSSFLEVVCSKWSGLNQSLLLYVRCVRYLRWLHAMHDTGECSSGKNKSLLKECNIVWFSELKIRFAGLGLGAASFTTALAAGSNYANVVDPTYDVSKFMAEPLTPRSTLVKDKDDIKVKMELFIMKIQVFAIGPFLWKNYLTYYTFGITGRLLSRSWKWRGSIFKIFCWSMDKIWRRWGRHLRSSKWENLRESRRQRIGSSWNSPRWCCSPDESSR